MEAGFDPAGWGALTPRLYAVHLEGAANRIRRENRARVELAWSVASLMRQPKLPELHQLLAGQEERDPEEVAAERRAQQRAWNETLEKRSWDEWRQR